jgi:hypothetical protein
MTRTAKRRLASEGSCRGKEAPSVMPAVSKTLPQRVRQKEQGQEVHLAGLRPQGDAAPNSRS